MSIKTRVSWVILSMILFIGAIVEAKSFVYLGVNSTNTAKSIEKRSIHYYKFSKKADWTYVVYLRVDSGDADLFGRYRSHVNSNVNQFHSINSGTEDDFFRFKSSSDGKYYLAVSGYAKSDYAIHVVGYPTEAPSSLEGMLTHPFKGEVYDHQFDPNQSYLDEPFTYQEYGPFGSPWGNPEEEFFGGLDYHHTGVDWYAPEGTEVYAAHDGTVTNTRSAGPQWGEYVEIVGNVNGTMLTTTYMHLQDSGRPAKGMKVKAGDTIGYIHDVSDVQGERSHLHFTIFLGDDHTNSIVGSLRYDKFPGDFIDPAAIELYGSGDGSDQSGETIRIGGSCEYGDSDKPGLYDCTQTCLDTGVISAWKGDGLCDDGAYSWGSVNVDLDCSAFGFDGGDCN